jgi:hypothetical protein
VSIGYHLNNFQDAVNGISTAPLPHSSNAAAAATNPIAPKTLCPVNSIKTIVENIKIAIAS